MLATEDDTDVQRTIEEIMHIPEALGSTTELRSSNNSSVYTHRVSILPTVNQTLSTSLGNLSVHGSQPLATRLSGEVTNDEIQTLYQRSNTTWQLCQQSQGRPIVSNQFLLVDELHRVLYCAAPKIGTTSWLLVFAYLTGKVNITLTNQDDNEFLAWKRENLQTIGLLYLDRYATKRRRDLQNDFFKFMFVRNPFERVISAYNDKFARQEGRAFYHQRYGKQIIRSFRRNATKQALATGSDVRFPEFFKFVIQTVKRGGADEHWKRMSDICGPCLIHYSMIGKMESFTKDANIILEKGFNLSQPIQFPENKGGHKTTTNHIYEYFKGIPQSDINEFVRLFKQDFLIGNYSSDISSISSSIQ